MLFIIALVTIALVRVNAGDSPVLSLKKKIQFPGTQEPTSFAIKSDDEILAAIYGEANTKSPKYTIFTGEQFEETIHSYENNNAPYTDTSISNSGIYAAQGQTIPKYPFRTQKEFKRNITKDASMISLDRKTWAYVARNENNCPVIEVASAYKDKIKQFNFDTYPSCSGNAVGILHDLKNGLVAFSSYIQYLYILDKQALKDSNEVVPIQKIDIFAVFSKGFGKIGDVSSFYNSTSNQSTIFLLDQSLANYYLLHFNTTSERYFYRNVSFYHPATKCQFYNQNTCYGFLGNYLVINQNIQNQIIAVSYDSNPFYRKNIIDINQKQDFIAVQNQDEKFVSIYQIDQNYQFSLFKTFNYSQHFGNDTRLLQGEFFSTSNQLILSFYVYDSSSIIYKKICKWNPNSQHLPCLQNSSSSYSQSLEGFSLVQFPSNSSNNFLFVVRRRPSDTKFIVEAYSLNSDDFTLVTSYNMSLEYSIFKVEIIYGKGWLNKFAISVVTYNDDCHEYVLNFQIIQNSSTINISFSNMGCVSHSSYQITKVPYKNMMAMMLGKMLDTNQVLNCQIVLYNLDGTLIDFLPKIIYEDCNISSYYYYKLISQDSFDYFIVEKRLNEAYLIDFYNISILDMSRKTYLYQKRSMFVNTNYIWDNNHIIFPRKKRYFSYWVYEYSGKYMIMYNISTIPLKIFKLENKNDTKFDFSIDQQNIQKNRMQFVYKNESLKEYLYFTINGSLYMMMNLSQLTSSSNYDQQAAVFNFTIYNTSQQYFTDVSRTLLASNGENIISLLSTNASFIAVFSYFFDGYDSRNIIIWNLTNNTFAMNTVDISMEGLAFIVKPSVVAFQPFSCPNNVPKNETESKFKNIYIQNSEEFLLSTFNKASTGRIAICSCLDGRYSYLPIISTNNQFEKVVAQRTLIEFALITYDASNIQGYISGDFINEPLAKFNSTLIDIFLVQNYLSKPTQKKIESSSLIDSQNRLLNKGSSIIVLRLSDYILVCYGSFSNCPGYLNVKANQIFAISQQTGLMAYVYSDSNQTESIHLHKTQPSSNTITSLQNFTLSKTKYVKGQVFSPKIKQLHFSSSGNLYVLAQDSSSNGFFAVLYSFTGGQCPKNMTVGKNYECECLENFTRSDFTSNTSQIVISEACKSCKKNFYYLAKEGKCICPSTFSYDENSGSCECLDGNIEGSDSESVCLHDTRENNIGWIIGGCLLGLFVLPLTGFLVKRKCIDKQKYKKEKYLSARQSSNISENQSLEGSGLGESLTNNNRVSSNSRTQQRQNLRGSNSQSERESVRTKRFSESQSERSSRGQRRRDSSSSGRNHRNLIRERSQESQYIIEPMLSSRQ